MPACSADRIKFIYAHFIAKNSNCFCKNSQSVHYTNHNE